MTPKRKKILIGIACVLVIGGIGNLFDKKDSAPAKPSTQVEQTKNQESIKVGIKAGIGDTEDRWKKDYGDLKGQDMVKNLTINGSNVTVVFAEETAQNITINKRNKYYKNDAIKDMIPADSTETNKEKDTSDSMLIKERTSYHSDTLEKAYPKSNGNFTMIDISDAGTRAYLYTVIDCTPQ